jgi:hypothetical protein
LLPELGDLLLVGSGAEAQQADLLPEGEQEVARRRRGLFGSPTVLIQDRASSGERIGPNVTAVHARLNFFRSTT